MTKDEAKTLCAKDLLLKLETSDVGLSQKEATARLTTYGPNVVKKQRVRALTILVRQFRSSLIYLLIAATLLSYGIQDYSDGTVILVILLINTLLSFFQEYKSEKMVEKLSQFISKQVHVKRDDEVVLIDQSQLVPGDVIIVREGDITPADLKLLAADNLQVDESQLTGESVLISKYAEEQVFTGSTIAKGEGTGVVYATGSATELGAIVTLSTQTKKLTEYEKSLQSFSTFLIKVVLAGLVVVFVLKLVLHDGLSNTTDLLLFVIAMAVAVVPEALPVIATVTLSNGALKMAKKHVVVKRLSSMEDFGNINLLCTDKTGTLTENKMAISSITSIDNELFETLAYAAITPLKGRKHRTDNSYDDAFLAYANEAIQRAAEHYAIVKELPFDPDAKRRRVVLADSKNKKHYLVVIGAPEALFNIAHTIHKSSYLHKVTEEGKTGLHHIAIAYREVTYDDDFDILKNERALNFLGFVSLSDPLRATSASTIKHAERLGIAIKILTGDGREVAEYIGREVGLVKDGDKVYTGDELQAMSESEFKTAVETQNVFARVSPVQKFNIIQALKETHVVGYQGDGINDAPALKLADVAIAVNTATDIAKESADIILLNKSLEVIINGVKYGRATFVNINKYVRYTMVSNFGNFIALAVLYLWSTNLPLLPVQVLLTSLLADIPLIMIAMDSVEDEDVASPEKHDVKELIFISLILGVPTALFELFYFWSIRFAPHTIQQTGLYMFFTAIAFIVFYAIRNRGHFWQAKVPPLALNVAFVVGFIVAVLFVYLYPFRIWFSFVPLTSFMMTWILMLVGVYFFVADTFKVWYYKYGSHIHS